MAPRARLLRLALVVALLVTPPLAHAGNARVGAPVTPSDLLPFPADRGDERTRVLIALDDHLTPGERVELAARGVIIEREYRVTPALLARVPPGALAESARFGLTGTAFVDRVRAVEALEPTLDRATALTRANASARADLGVTGRGVTVAVVDSGIDASHPDLEGRVKENVKFVDGRFVPSALDSSGHGTHVAGIIAGSGTASPGRSHAGVAPGASVVGLDISSAFDTASAMDAFDWLFLNKDRLDVRVVVNAWGRKASAGEAFDPDDPLVRAADRLTREGIVVVFSASNHGPRAATLSLDAQNPRVITVGATDDAGVLAAYSSRGPVVTTTGTEWVKPDLVAPGTRVVSARAATAAPDGVPPGAPVIPEPGALPGALADAATAAADAPRHYRTLSGTSQAAPHVAGVIALMLEANPRLAPADVANALRETAIDLGPPGPDAGTGFGLVDARDAVLRARGLAPERGNVILAGGTESFTARGRYLAAEAVGVQTEPAPALAASGEIALDVPVKPGATAVAFRFRWEPADAATFRAYLTNGERTLGPWSAPARDGAARVLQGQVPSEDVAPGEWRLVLKGAAMGDVWYAAEAVVTIAGAPDRAHGALPPEYRLPDDAYGPVEGALRRVLSFLEETGIRARFAVRELASWAAEEPVAAAGAAVSAGAGAAVLVGAGFVLATRRRDP